MPYPVLQEKALPPPTRRLLGARRNPTDLPTAGPGTVLVFRIGDRYEQVTRDGHLTGSEPNVVHATGVSLVDVRERLLHAEVTRHSATPADDFVIRVGVRCRVSDPAAVAASGITDVEPMLVGYLEDDRELQRLAEAFEVDQVNQLRQAVDHRLRARWSIAAFAMDGLEASLAGVDVLTPEELRAHSQRLRDEKRRQELDELTRGLEDANVERIYQHLADERRAAALGIVQKEYSVAQVLDRFQETEQRRDMNLMEITKKLAEQGHFDRTPVDSRHLVDTFLERFAGVSPSPLELATSERDRAARELPHREDDDKGPQHVPDEDELAG